MFSLSRLRSRAAAVSALAAAALLTLTVGTAAALPTHTDQPIDRLTFVTDGNVASDTDAITLGLEFQVDTPGVVMGVEFIRGNSANTATVVSMWNSSGVKIAEAGASGSQGGASGAPTGATGLVHAWFYEPIPVQPGNVYTVSYFSPAGRFNIHQYEHQSASSQGNILMPTNAGKFTYASNPAFPSSTFNSSSYKVTPIFVADLP